MRGINMKILLTGSEGFIGKHLYKKLKEEHEVIRFDKKITDWVDGNQYSRDIQIFDNIDEFLYTKEPEVVIHLAAQSQLRYSLKQPLNDAYTNIIGSINLLECCKNSSVKKFIYASTGGARYGNAEGLVKEDCQIDPIAPYGISKHTVEHYLKYYHNEYGLDYSILCFGNVYGEEDPLKNNRLITKTINSNIHNKELEVYGDGSSERDYLYVGDLVDFISLHFNNPNICNEIINIGTGKTYSVLDVINIVDTISNKKTKIKFQPAIKSEVKKIGLNVEKVKKLTGWEAKANLVKGICRTYKWFVNNSK